MKWKNITNIHICSILFKKNSPDVIWYLKKSPVPLPSYVFSLLSQQCIYAFKNCVCNWILPVKISRVFHQNALKTTTNPKRDSIAVCLEDNIEKSKCVGRGMISHFRFVTYILMICLRYLLHNDTSKWDTQSNNISNLSWVMTRGSLCMQRPMKCTCIPLCYYPLCYNFPSVTNYCPLCYC